MRDNLEQDLRRAKEIVAGGSIHDSADAHAAFELLENFIAEIIDMQFNQRMFTEMLDRVSRELAVAQERLKEWTDD